MFVNFLSNFANWSIKVEAAYANKLRIRYVVQVLAGVRETDTRWEHTHKHTHLRSREEKQFKRQFRPNCKHFVSVVNSSLTTRKTPGKVQLTQPTAAASAAAATLVALDAKLFPSNLLAHFLTTSACAPLPATFTYHLHSCVHPIMAYNI